MPADRPAPSALDALLSGVDAAAGTGHVEYIDALADAAPRLAAIVRVLVEAVNQAASWGEGATVGPEFDCPYHAMEARSALARAEAIAKGE